MKEMKALLKERNEIKEEIRKFNQFLFSVEEKVIMELLENNDYRYLKVNWVALERANRQNSGSRSSTYYNQGQNCSCKVCRLEGNRLPIKK